MSCGIYKIENKINHHLYIGKAKNIETRWRQHKWEGSHLRYKTPLYLALHKYGIENFDFIIIEEMSLEQYQKIGNQREQYWIKYYDAYTKKDNYNITIGRRRNLRKLLVRQKEEGNEY